MSSQVPYSIRISKRAKRVSLRVDHNGLTVVTPRELPERKIIALLQQHSDWIAQHQEQIEAATFQEELLQDGSNIELFGDEEKIHFQPLGNGEKAKVTETPDGLLVQAIDGEHKQTLLKWLRSTARQAILARVEELAGIYGFEYNKIAVRDQSTRWGSCSTQKNLNFSWRLMLAPLVVMDYVIIHELAHTQQMNHSKKFWAIVERCMPDYKIHRKWLKTHGNVLKMY